MFFYRVILLSILCGTIAVCLADENSKDVTDDQVAMASENIAPSSTEFEEPITETNSSTELPELDETTDIHYENSNGFIPMISSQKFLSSELLINSTNTTIDEDTTESPIISLSDYDNNVENNPAFFTEARILLNISQTEADRRSYDSQDGQKEFELLKVNKQTPKIANYHEFYENMQSNLNQASNTKLIIDENKKYTNNLRTKNRIKQINDYLSDDFDQDRDNTQVYSHYYTNKNNKPITTTTVTTTTEAIFEPEKVNHNYPQHTASKYGIFGESVTRQKTSSLPNINYDNSNDYLRDNKKNQQFSLKPVVVIEPSDYKVDVKYNNQQSIGQVSTMNPYDNQKKINDESEDRYDKNEDGSNESSDYLEITERPKKIYKSRRRPYTSENSRRLVKEHRGNGDGSSSGSDVDDTKKINSSSSKIKSHRSRAKPNYWTDNEQNNNQENQSKGDDNNKNIESQNNENSWNQVGQNIELSQSNSYQLNQNNKPNVLVPVNLNLVPLTNFDHSTAIGTSQGFDISNAGVQNYITAGPIVSTASPLISTGPPNQSLQNSAKNYHQYSTPIPEIIVGQSTYQNPLQAVFLQNKYPQNNNIKTQYFQSTVAPVFTVSQSTIAPKTSNQDNSQVHHLLVSQPTLQSILQSPLNGYNNNILVNTRGLNGQNQQTPIQNNNNAQTVSSEIENSSKKTTFTPTTNNYLTSASYSVNNNIPASSNIHNVIAQSQNNQQFQQLFPALIQQQQQQQSTNFQPTYAGQYNGNAILGNTWTQLQQLQTPIEQNKNFKPQFHTLIRSNDNLGSTSNNNINTYNAIQNTNKDSQLPVVGMQTVQIQNPNFNAFNQYQGAVLTTPIPILTSTTPDSINIHSYVDSLTHIGAQSNNNNNQWRTYAADRPAYNPMNFVPSTELVDSQIMLNSKAHVPDALSHNLNLVPAIPGGNFYKNTPTAQMDLIKKPKLSTDLEKYAEEMFKESLRTIYNTHKWNSDKKIRNLTVADIAELKRLKDELDRIKSNMVKSKNIKEIIEGHHSETNVQTVDPGPLNKRPGITVSELEQLFKTEFNNNDLSNNNDNNNIKINDYLTPPKVNSFVSKNPFLDNDNNNNKIKKQVKKRPIIKGTRIENNKLRPHNRPHGKRPISGGIETAASSHSTHLHRRPFKNENNSGRKEIINYNNYPTFTTSSPDLLYNHHDDYKYSKNDELDFDSPKLHNLLGLLMKNKQLPRGASSSLYRDNDDIEKYLDDEQRRAGYEFNNDKIKNIQKNINSQPYLITYY
ncbi:hypothetical protein HCN44_002659 [Aphidius gifuensis]|uniref:Uncharacterized protein n=1 Tax=Aphidius gifuensis TaxID=684658 RepID=A0A835CPA9_APHGI|nr:GATA zinc finger domain-containing protein 14-like [Aphidius gifuensis]KAF7991097.1 hypothetical protein HCN44_002659 [Aphidius gifuensis]